MRHKMCWEELSGWKVKLRPSYKNIPSPKTLQKILPTQKNVKRNPLFQEIPLFASSIYFTLPEIVMGPIWVPNASINTSWANLRILIIGWKTSLQRSISKLIAINSIDSRPVPTNPQVFLLLFIFSLYFLVGNFEILKSETSFSKLALSKILVSYKVAWGVFIKFRNILFTS